MSHVVDWLRRQWLATTISPVLLAGLTLPCFLALCQLTALMAGSPGAYHSWLVGDWAVNFADGFVRRGLSGELLAFVASLLAVPWVDVLYGVKLAAYAIVFVSLLMIVRLSGRVYGSDLLLLFSPLGLLLPLLTPSAGGRKEILFLALLAGVTVRRCLCRDDLGIWGMLVIGLLYAVLILMHESVVFFLPMLLYILFYNSRPALWHLVALAVFPLAAFLMVVLASAEATPAGICLRMASWGVVTTDCQLIQAGRDPYPGAGAIAWLQLDFMGNLEYLYRDGIYLGWDVWALCGLALWAWWHGRHLWMISVVIAMLPLLLISWDWGRWLHVMLVSGVFAGMLQRERDGHVRTARGYDRVGPVVLLTLCGILLWRVRYCCAPGIELGLLRFLPGL